MGFHPNFPAERLALSQKAKQLKLDNSIPAPLMGNAERLSQALAQIEAALKAGHPRSDLILNSAFRSNVLNAAVGGSATSSHKMALAADITASGLTVIELANLVKSAVTDFDQIIVEFGRWVHVGLAQDNRKSRNQCLTAKSQPTVNGKNKTVYYPGFVA